MNRINRTEFVLLVHDRMKVPIQKLIFPPESMLDDETAFVDAVIERVNTVEPLGLSSPKAFFLGINLGIAYALMLTKKGRFRG